MKFRYITKYLVLYAIAFLLNSCSKSENSSLPTQQEVIKELTIFHINDTHGSLENFAKIKHIVDKEASETNVIFVAAGDMFSGNPVVDNHDEKGFPMVDLMNKTGVDVAVLGNHEFDYGETVLNNRMMQANFDWICANVSMQGSDVMQPFEYASVTEDGIKVTFLGLVETNGKDDIYIPSTHPWRVQNLTFEPYNEVVVNYESLKEDTHSDIYVALTHLGESSDRNLAANYPYFDLIIGGHSHTKTNTTVNGIPIYHAGSYLNYLGKVSLVIKDDVLDNISFELIDLNTYSIKDAALESLIQKYNDDADLDDIIGYANAYHSKANLGVFYTDALKTMLDADISFQNPGGVRNDLDEGPITTREIYSIDPFNNGSVSYDMTVGAIKKFLMETRTSVYYSGIIIEQDDQNIFFYDENDQLINDDAVLKLAVNDYIPAVYDTYFSNPTLWPFTTAEALIQFLKTGNGTIDYSMENNFFRFGSN